MAFPVPVDLDLGLSPVGGLLATARALPAGWQRGISFTDTACLAPVTMGECPSGTDLKPAQRADKATFRPVDVIQAVECSSMGENSFDVSAVAGAALTQTAEYGLAFELLTGTASTRDLNPNNADPAGNPALVNTATSLGAAFATVGAALACLDQNLHAATSGRGGFILVGADMASYLLGASLIWRDGARWRTAAGSTVIVNAAFDGRAPVADGTGTAPVAGAPLYMYGTAGVWVGLGETRDFADVNRSVNTATSRQEQIALAAFSPCSTFAAGSTAATSCG